MGKRYRYKISQLEDVEQFDVDRCFDMCFDDAKGDRSVLIERLKSFLSSVSPGYYDVSNIVSNDKPQMANLETIGYMRIIENLLKWRFPDSVIKVVNNVNFENHQMGIDIIKTESGVIYMTVEEFSLSKGYDFELFKTILDYCDNNLEIEVDNENRIRFVFEFKDANFTIGE